MANLEDILNSTTLPDSILNQEDIDSINKKSSTEIAKQNKYNRQQKVDKQLAELLKGAPIETLPSPTELNKIITNYFDTVFPENYSKYTLHTFIGMTEKEIQSHIIPDEDLNPYYEFAMEKLKAKTEITMQIAGRSTDSFAMQNIAGWKKKDPEGETEVSGLADLHQAVREYKKKKNIDEKESFQTHT